MKSKKNYMTIYMIRFMLLTCFLWIANIAVSSAQYIRAEVTGDDYFEQIVHLKAYTDAACTVPTTFSGPVNFRLDSWYGCDVIYWPVNYTMTISQFNANNYLRNGLYTNMQVCEDWGHIEDVIDAFGAILPGSGYSIAPVPIVYL